MEDVAEYTVVVEPTWDISKAVNALLDNGWKLHGHSMMSNLGNVIQPMIKLKDDSSEE